MASKIPLVAEDFVNGLKQTIKPGDEVVIVTTGYSHRVSINKGEYLGKKNGNVSCRVAESRTEYRRKDTGEQVSYWWVDAEKRGLLPERPTYPTYPKRPTGWNYQTPEWVEYNAKVKVLQSEYQEASSKYYEAYNKAKADNYEDVKVPFWRHTTLQLNRIYKLDTKAWELQT